MNTRSMMFADRPISSDITKKELDRRWVSEAAKQAVAEAVQVFDASFRSSNEQRSERASQSVEEDVTE